MKRLIALFALWLLVPLTVHGALYIKQKEHTDAHYHHGSIDPEVNRDIEQWISGKRMAMEFENRKIIIDLAKKKMVILLKDKKEYVEADLPLDLAAVVDESIVPLIQMYKTTGEVETLEEKKELPEGPCRGYRITSWIPYEGTRYNETEMVSWVTEKVKVDLDTYTDLVTEFYRLENLHEDFIKIAREIKGLSLQSASTRYAEGNAVTTTSSVVTMEEREAPEGLFAVPEGFSKKDKLTREDLQ